MKSGTSHIQSRMYRNRDALLAQGVLVPGETWSRQVAAVKDVMAMHREGRASSGPWDRLSKEMAAHDGTSLISMEYLGPVKPGVAAGVVAAVSTPEVVITVRDLNRCLAAMWQETIQNGRSWTWAEYLEAAQEQRPGRRLSRAEVSEAGRTFWRQQDAVRIARTWGELAPVTVLTVPPPDASRSLLWNRVCEVLGLPATGWAEAEASNESIGAPSALALRRLNELLDEADLRFPVGSALRKQFLAKQVLAARKKQEPAIGLPVSRWLRRHSGRMVKQLRALDLTLVGDWDDLDPVAVPGVDPADVADHEVLEASLAGLVAMVQRDLTRAG